MGGIGFSGFADFREWDLWRALGNCARGGGIRRYWAVLACPGGGDVETRAPNREPNKPTTIL